MKKIILSCFTLSLVLSCFGFDRDYVKQAKLTEAEEKIVIELAKKRGIEKIAKISTYNMYPSAARGINVQGVEVIKGREVSYKVLNVKYKKWLQPGAAPRKGDLQMGDFWVRQPRTQKKIILWIDETDYRVSSVRGIELKECETILVLFLAGKFEVGPDVNERSLGQVDWSKPSRFSKRGETISVGFPHKGGPGSGFFDLQIKLEGKKLTIMQMFQAIP